MGQAVAKKSLKRDGGCQWMSIHSAHLVVLLAHMGYNLYKKNITKTLRGTNQDIKHQLPDLFHLDEKCRDFIKIIRSVSFCIFVTF